MKEEKEMVIDAKEYRRVCSCGKKHEMTTDFCVVEAGCLKKLDEYLAQAGMSGFCTAIYDENTWQAAKGARPAADQEIILNPEHLHANEHAVGEVLGKLSPKAQYLIATGAGTIHDITRYCAFERGIPFVSCPTAASVDGFCSSVAAMTWNGCKKTIPARAPKFVVADLDIIAKAPIYLARSGFGDMVGKYVALADWKIASLVTGEFYCEEISGMMEKATGAVLESAEGIARQETAAFEKLTYGLLLSGLAMQLMGNSRPASGAEHHISHLIETAPAYLGISSDALHGEKVGVATILASAEYHRLAGLTDIRWRDYPKPEESFILQTFGEELGKGLVEENREDCARGITKEMLAAHWKEICAIIAKIPGPEQLRSLYRRIGAKAELADIGLSDDKTKLLLDDSPIARNRLTLMRLRRAMEV